MKRFSIRSRRRQTGWALGVALALIPLWAQAHDPVFGLGPHVLYKGGVEVAAEAAAGKRGTEREDELALELTYGLTGDWAVGLDLPWRRVDEGTAARSGGGDIALFTKYRFWRHDTLGAQESAAVLAKLKLPTADDGGDPPLGSGTTDALLGLTWGYESRRWYRWASLRYRRNGEDDSGLRRSDALLLDLVGGIRPRPTGYLEPDTVWLLELNGEHLRPAERNGQTVAGSGRTEWFVSPGLFWTLRNFAVKAGVQLPVYSARRGDQPRSDWRARLILEWHL